jgi:hypothetical protein
MLLSGIALLAGLLPAAHAADIPKVLDCGLDERRKVPKECEAPIAPVAAVVPGLSYIAKIECKDCPYEDPKDREVVTGDHVLVCIIIQFKFNMRLESGANHAEHYSFSTLPSPTTIAQSSLTTARYILYQRYPRPPPLLLHDTARTSPMQS